MLVDGKIQSLVVGRKRIADGSRNLAKEPALTKTEAIARFLTGIS